MTPIARLTAIGSALYGPRWRSPLARDLGVTYRTLRRWVKGDHPVPPEALAKLEKLERAAEKLGEARR